MDIERAKLVEAGVSVAAVAVMLGVFYFIGARFNDGSIGSDGGLYLLGSIVLFVVLMGVTGLYLAFTLSEPAEEETVEGFE